MTQPCSTSDREALRALAGRVREIAELPEMRQRRERWYRHNALQGERPMVLCFPEGAWPELLGREACRCDDPTLRGWELALRRKLYWWDHLRDDAAIEPAFNIGWRVSIGTYGVEVPQVRSEERGSYVWEAPVKDIERDLPGLHFRDLSVDRAQTQRDLECAQAIFGDLLPPRLRGPYWWTLGMTWEAAKLIGLENLMLAMYDDPDGLHQVMSFLRDEHLHFTRWFEREGLLSLMNEDDYTGSGGLAYTHELPQPDWPGGAVRLRDIWGFGESQETVGISPAMFSEFVLPYQVPLLEKFGLNCYGCCEGLDRRIDAILADVPRLRRVSVSPWADQQVMAEKLAGRCIFSRKPNPTLVCAGFDEHAIRADLRQTLQIAGQGPLEFIMKDTHTVQHKAWRLSQWVRIALEEAERFAAVGV